MAPASCTPARGATDSTWIESSYLHPRREGLMSMSDPEPSKYEFKVTVHPHEEAALRAELEAREAKLDRRKVYFYDTKKLELFAEHLVLRARSTDGKPDSTVKLRPALDAGARAEWVNAGGRYEVDVVGAAEVGSVKLDRPGGELDKDAKLDQDPRDLFGAVQAAFVPDLWNKLEVLGPIHAYLWKIEYPALPDELCVEEWTVPGGPHFMEMSFKAKPAEKDDAERSFHSLLDGLGICRYGDPEPKTTRVLEHFAARL
jgi:hypothetical protein